jgi:hypothetical protein
MTGFAVSIPDLPKTLVILDMDGLDRRDELALAAINLPIASAEDLAKADRINKAMQEMIKAIHADRLSRTKPIDEIVSQAIKLEGEAVEPIKNAILALSQRIRAYETEMQRIYDEKVRRAREETERRQREEDEAAEAERARMQAEAEENAAPGELPEEIPVTAALPTRVEAVRVGPPPPKSSSVKGKTNRDVIVDDESLIPIEWAGAVIRPPDLKAIKALLVAKAKIPGVHLEETQGVQAKG